MHFLDVSSASLHMQTIYFSTVALIIKVKKLNEYTFILAVFLLVALTLGQSKFNVIELEP